MSPNRAHITKLTERGILFSGRVINRKQEINKLVIPSLVSNEDEGDNVKTSPTAKQFLCSECNRFQKSKNSLRAHIYKYHSGRDAGQEHKCEICDQVYKLKGGLIVHMRNKHGKNAVPVICIDCGKEYPNKMAHYKHVYAKHKHRITNKDQSIIVKTV
jgi:RNase P subunit RPR2